MKSIEYQTVQSIDPFYLYLQVTSLVGKNRTFLLEAGRDEQETHYQMSLIGACPVLEVQVKDGVVTLFANSNVFECLDHLRGYPNSDVRPHAKASWPSVAGATSRVYAPTDVMAFLEELRQALKGAFAPDFEHPFSAGFLGYVGYDSVHYLEDLPKTTEDDRNLPDIRLQWHAVVIQLSDGEIRAFRQDDASPLSGLTEEADEIVKLVGEAADSGVSASGDFAMDVEDTQSETAVHYDVSEEAFVDSVVKAKQYIRQGDIFQVVLSTRIRIDGALHPYVAYNRLRKINPSPYMFVAEYEGMCIYGASPEVQFRSVAGISEMKPIAGTSKGRGLSQEEDTALVKALKEDAKESAEHVMLVDLCRNDLGRVSRVGTVHVPDFMIVERYSHLYHLVSRVEGQLREDVSVFHALVTTFPNGTLSGAPKIRAMEIIDELEHHRRGPYGGFIGMIDADANANTAIVIRTVVETDGVQYVQAGAGIVLDSVPEREWEECHHKAGALLDVLRGVKTPI